MMIFKLLRESNEINRPWSETDLTEDSLARQQFGAQTNYEAQHCEAAIPSLSKVAEAESGLS